MLSLKYREHLCVGTRIQDFNACDKNSRKYEYQIRILVIYYERFFRMPSREQYRILESDSQSFRECTTT
jgi:hypothetical protein